MVAFHEALLLCLFVLTLKDWFINGVDSYPYCASAVTTTVLFFATYLTLRQPRCVPTFIVCDTPRLRPIGIILTIVTLVLLGAILSDLPSISWTADTIVGYGLGSCTLGTSFLASAGDPVSVSNTLTALGAIVAEQGLLAVVALSSLLVVSTLMVCLTPSILSMAGVVGVDVLLLRTCYGPAFLTCDTVWGTVALAICLGCIGSGLRGQSASSLTGSAKLTPAISMHKTLRSAAISLVVAMAFIFGGDCILKNILKSEPALISAPSVTLASISLPMQDATIAMEDGHFYTHHGIDWAAMHRAIRFDLRFGEIKQGGSTITEQLAKNIYLQNNDHTIGRKLEDIALAVEMDRLLSKQRILELYLNTIDYGMGQHGIKAASAYYFHKTPAQLTAAEAAILVGIVPDPMQVQLDLNRVQRGQQTALGRMAFFFPGKYTQTDVDTVSAIPLDHLIYPYKDSWDRGATETIPGTWHGVSFYFFADPEVPEDINNASACIKPELAGFLDEAHNTYHLVGVDHLGLYNDRGMRQADSVLSAHAFGQAIDISGFRFADGTRVTVKDRSNPKSLERLLIMESLLKKHFDIVVDWKDDPLRHQTHFHCEVRGPRDFAPRDPEAAQPIVIDERRGDISRLN